MYEEESYSYSFLIHKFAVQIALIACILSRRMRYGETTKITEVKYLVAPRIVSWAKIVTSCAQIVLMRMLAVLKFDLTLCRFSVLMLL